MEEARYDNQSHATHELYHEDEVIDTLSLSDLLIYDNNGNPQDFYQVDDQNPNLDADDDQSFEFSSELLKTSASNSVVFCGKIIAYKETSAGTVPQNTHNHTLESKKQQTRHKERWRFARIFKRPSRLSTTNLDSDKLDLKYEVPIRKVSILDSATKSRWYLLMFGFGSNRFPTEMHIRDLKKRQTSMGRKNGGDGKISGGNGGGIGSWSLVRFLGCGGGGGRSDNHHPNAIVKIE